MLVKLKFRNIISVFILALFLLSAVFGYCQKYNNTEISQNRLLLDSIEAIYGSDDLLVSGRFYKPTHSYASGNPYFLEKNWCKGTLFIRDRAFKYVDCTYNIENDKVIIKANLKSGASVQLEINIEYLDSFIIGNHHFINSDGLKTTESINGYYEQIYNSDYLFLIKHSKTFINKYTDLEPYGRFSKVRSAYYIYFNSQLSKLFTKKSFLHYFKPYKKEIRKFFRKNNIKYKKASNYEIYKLMKYCNELSPTPE